MESKKISTGDSSIDIQSQIVNSLKRKYNIDAQIKEAVKKWDKQFTERNQNLTNLFTMASEIEKRMDKVTEQLYKPYQPIIKHCESVEFDEEGKNISSENASCFDKLPSSPLHDSNKLITQQISPKAEPLSSPDVGLPKINQSVYIKQNSLLQPWIKGKITTIKKVSSTGEDTYVVLPDSGGRPNSRKLKSIAYSEPSPLKLNVGTRVVAQYFGPDDDDQTALYYSGIIAENASVLNQNRYLVFFDDGCAQYCSRERVLVVFQSSPQVWLDIPSGMRSFIENYLEKHSKNKQSMVQLKIGETVKTELQGEWLDCKVVSIDASLVRIRFSKDQFEWIYRGSTRFWQLNEEECDN